MRYEVNPELMQFLRKNTNLIISTFNKTGTRNLRILKHALNDFQKVFESVKKALPEIDNEILKSLLIFTIAVSFEIKAGKVTKNKFVDISSNEEYKLLLTASDNKKSNQNFYLKEFDNNYYFNAKYQDRFFYFVEIYVRTRIFDMQVFKKEMEDIERLANRSNLPSYKRILFEEYWRIPDAEFDKVIYDTLDAVRTGKLELIEYLKLFIYFNFFNKKGLIREDINSLKNQFMAGMNLASIKASYYENIQEYLSDLKVIDMDEAVEEVFAYFYIINNQLKDKMNKEYADEVFAILSTKTDKFLYEITTTYANIPIFAHYDPYMLFEKMLRMSNQDIVMLKEIIKERINNPKLYEEEQKNIKLLKQTIQEYIAAKVRTVKIVLLDEFAEIL